MINKLKPFALFSVASVLIACGNQAVPEAKPIPLPVKSLQNEQELQDQVLGQYSINMMQQTNARSKFSEAKKQSLAHSIVRVANDVFTSLEHKKAFIAVLAIESGFEKSAQSPTGPRGLSQVAKAAFAEGLASCGITNFKDEDVWETELNLYAGACYFRSLLEKTGNDPYVSIVAYNQGLNSVAAKSFSKSGTMDNIEALKYVARFSYLKQVVKETQAPGAPEIQQPKLKKE